MGEEEKKPEEKIAEEEVKKDGEEKKTEETTEETPPPPPPPPPPPEETILRVFMHCEGCAKKVRKCLRGFEGVEDVKTDCKTHIVTVKGKKAAENPLKVLERVERKSHRKVELLSPTPKPHPPEDEEKKDEPKPVQEKKQEVVIITVVKVHMHCEACAQEIRKRILRMKGVKEAVPDLKSSQVTVKGVFDPPKLIEYVYKRTGKHAVIVKTEPEKKEEEGEKKGGEEEEEKKKEEGGGGGEGENKGGGEEKKKEGDEAKPVEGEEEKTEKVEIELRKNEFYYYPTKYNMEYVYPPQIFSDENPNACSVM